MMVTEELVKYYLLGISVMSYHFNKTSPTQSMDKISAKS